MGPALLPAPLSPAIIVILAFASSVSARSQFDQTPGCGDACPSTVSAFRTQGYCRIVMLVASSPIIRSRPLGELLFLIVAPAAWSVFQRLSAFRTGKASTGNGDRRWVPSGGWSGSEEPFRPPGGSNRIAAFSSAQLSIGIASIGILICRSVRSLGPPCRNRAFHCSFRAAAIRSTTARLSLHLRFAKSVPKNLPRRVFQRCCGHRRRISRVEFPFFFKRLVLKNSGPSSRSTRRGCASLASRTSKICGSCPQSAANAVDKTG